MTFKSFRYPTTQQGLIWLKRKQKIRTYEIAREMNVSRPFVSKDQRIEFPIDNGGFFVTDVISNGEEAFTVLSVMYPELLESILDCFSVHDGLDSDLHESFLKFGTA
ncbi:MAG: hypothetical protein ACFFCP_15700 [Promethearchaeota archaeon]